MTDPTTRPVIITVAHDADTDRLRVRVSDGTRVVYTATTRWGHGAIARVERYLLRARVYRTDRYTSDDNGTMVALGQYAGVAA
jgi:hypothetical protein